MYKKFIKENQYSFSSSSQMSRFSSSGAAGGGKSYPSPIIGGQRHEVGSFPPPATNIPFSSSDIYELCPA